MPAYRIIHALRLNLGPEPGHGPKSKRELIVNLNRDGNSLHGNCHPHPPKSRIIDIRAGNEILHKGQWLKVYGVEPFLASMLTEAQAFGRIGEGYIFRLAEKGVLPK